MGNRGLEEDLHREDGGANLPRGFDLTRLVNWGLDRILGIGSDEVLNAGPSLETPPDLCRELARASNEMKAAALDGQRRKLNYSRLAEHEAYALYRRLTHALARYSPLESESREGQIAFWVNLYNSLIMDAVIYYRVKGSLRSHFSVFRRAAYDVAGLHFSAEDIEHGVLRGNRKNPILPLRPFWREDPRKAYMIQPPDPRIHFALNCAANSCPPIAFYRAEGLNEQLSLAASSFMNGGGASYDPERNILHLSKILDWYAPDFGGEQGMLAFIREHIRDEEARHAIERGIARIQYLDYDWTLAATTGIDMEVE